MRRDLATAITLLDGWRADGGWCGPERYPEEVGLRGLQRMRLPAPSLAVSGVRRSARRVEAGSGGPGARVAPGREVLSLVLENARLARERRLPICQDTGLSPSSWS